MAEFVFKHIVCQNNLQDKFIINSAATSTEEMGNDMHYGTKQKLQEKGINYTKRCARQIKKSDYKEYDYIIGMEDKNIRNIMRIIGEDKDKKVFKLLDFSDNPRDIADPWYTGNFDKTYEDVLEGCNGLLEYLTNNKI